MYVSNQGQMSYHVCYHYETSDTCSEGVFKEYEMGALQETGEEEVRAVPALMLRHVVLSIATTTSVFREKLLHLKDLAIKTVLELWLAEIQTHPVLY